MHRRTIGALLLATLSGVRPASGADVRTALVIGNAAYDTVAALKNPVNDAHDLAQTLRSFDFDVLSYENLAQQPMEQAIRSFGARISTATVALFYYAGHAAQVDGRNYLIPVGASIESEMDIKYHAVDLGLILDEFERHRNGVNIVILDACRDNPFRGFRGLSKGLATTDAPPGTLIAYATAPGSVAADGTGRNGIYTKHLVEVMRTPGLKVEEVFKRVRIAVYDETRGRQTPWEASSLTTEFYFRGGDPMAASIGRENVIPDATAGRSRSQGRFQRASDGTVFDTVLGADWYCPAERETYTLDGARDLAKTLPFGTHGGWRLPSEPEIRSLAQDMDGALATLPGLQADRLTWYWLSESSWLTARGKTVRFSQDRAPEIEETATSERHRPILIRNR